MDTKLAMDILGVDSEIDKQELKRKYRQLMRMAHPDNGKYANNLCAYSAQDINEAYTILSENITEKVRNKSNSSKKWHAQVNKYAFAPRVVYDEVTDSTGNVIGVIEIASGKYMWEKDEEFHLFLKSIYDLSKSILDRIDADNGMCAGSEYEKYHAELSYLIAGQYIDSHKVLFELNLDVESEEDAEIFYVPAMLEGDVTKAVKDNKIYPAALRNHRLYVCDSGKNELGYISFADDKLAFVVIPLLEKRNMQIKMTISDNDAKVSKRGKKYTKVGLWIRVPNNTKNTSSNNINLKIGEILNKYENR